MTTIKELNSTATIEKKKSSQIDGFWYVYRFSDHGANFKRTILCIDTSDNNHSNSFRTLYHGRRLTGGSIEEYGRFRTIKFIYPILTKTIEISFLMPETDEETTVLSGIIRSTWNNRVMAKNCILYYIDDQTQPIDQEEIVDILHSSTRNNGGQKSITERVDDAVLEYLTRLKTIVSAQSIVPANIKTIIDENKATESLKYVRGRYFVILPKVNDTTQFHFLTLQIDALGAVIEQMVTEIDGIQEKVSYYGKAVMKHNVLRLSNLTDDERKSEYMFFIMSGQSEAPKLMEGISTAIDSLTYPTAEACIAIRHSEFSKILGKASDEVQFNAGYLVKSTPEYFKIDRYVEKILQQSIVKNFEIRKSITLNPDSNRSR